MRKENESCMKRIDSKGHRTPQSGSADEEIGIHDTTKTYVSQIERREYWRQK